MKYLRRFWRWLLRFIHGPQPRPLPRRKPRTLPPPDYIGRRPSCENGVEGCGIKVPHSHVDAFMRRLKEKR